MRPSSLAPPAGAARPALAGPRAFRRAPPRPAAEPAGASGEAIGERAIGAAPDIGSARALARPMARGGRPPESPPPGADPPLVRPAKKPAGLSRTPSGGLAAAAGLDALPPPPVAVRNLVELAAYAHLASNMSQMHHR
jgi:hypothetical protein